ncbi:hypothetical protein JCM8097_002350 [Rhodosporidiobolus ruineniae]
MSRYSSSGLSASTAATSVSGGMEEDELYEEDKDEPVAGLAPPRSGLALPLTPSSISEAFDFPLPPGTTLSSATAGALVEEPSNLEVAAASFANASSSVAAFVHDEAAARLPSYASRVANPDILLKTSPSLASVGTAAGSAGGSSGSSGTRRSARPMQQWAVDPLSLGEEEEDILAAVLPMVEEDDLAADGLEAELVGRSPRLVPVPQIRQQRPSVDVSASGLAGSAPTALRSPRTPTSSPGTSSSRLGSFLSKSPSLAFPSSPSTSSTSPRPPRSPSMPTLSPSSPSTKTEKRSSALFSSLTSSLGLSRNRSKSIRNGDKGEKEAEVARLSVIGETVGTGSGTGSGRSTASGGSVTDQLAGGLLPVPVGFSGAEGGGGVLRSPFHSPSSSPNTSTSAFARSPSPSFPYTPSLASPQPSGEVRILPSSKAAKMLGLNSGREVLVPSPSPGASPRPSPRQRSRVDLSAEEGEKSPALPSPSGFAARRGGTTPPPPPLVALPSSSSPSASLPLPSPAPSSGNSLSRSAGSSSKAAKMLGLSAAEVGKAVLSPTSPAAVVLGAGGGAKVEVGVKLERGMKRWPAVREEVREWEVASCDLYKLSSTTSSLLHTSKLTFTPRHATLSRYSSSSSPLVYSLHTYPTRALSETETSRLRLSPGSVVCAPLDGETPSHDRGGREFAIKVTGQVWALAKDGSGRAERRDGAWVLGMDDLELYKEWMGRLKEAVAELKEEVEQRSRLGHGRASRTSTASSSTGTSVQLALSPSVPVSPTAPFDLDAARQSAAASLRAQASTNADFAETARATLTSTGWRVVGGLPATTASGVSSISSGTGGASRNPSIASGAESLDGYSLYSLEAASSIASIAEEPAPRTHLPPSASFLADWSDEEEEGDAAPPLSASAGPPRLSLSPLPLPQLISPRSRTFSQQLASDFRRESDSSAFSHLSGASLPPPVPPPKGGLPPLPPTSSSSTSAPSKPLPLGQHPSYRLSTHSLTRPHSIRSIASSSTSSSSCRPAHRLSLGPGSTIASAAASRSRLSLLGMENIPPAPAGPPPMGSLPPLPPASVGDEAKKEKPVRPLEVPPKSELRRAAGGK